MGVSLPSSTRGRIAALLAAALILLAIIGQLVLPRLGEGALRDRLTANGGVADVSLSAFPAARLLWGSGDSLRIDGSGLGLEVDPSDPVVLDDLDRFGEVAISLHDVEAGPFRIASLTLSRHGDIPYALTARTTTSAAKLASYGLEGTQLPGSGIVGAIIGATGVGGAAIPIDLDLQMDSEQGRIVIVQGGGTIAGVPIGPLAELITSAIAIRL